LQGGRGRCPARGGRGKIKLKIDRQKKRQRLVWGEGKRLGRGNLGKGGGEVLTGKKGVVWRLGERCEDPGNAYLE